jgi:hypothetical protein
MPLCISVKVIFLLLTDLAQGSKNAVGRVDAYAPFCDALFELSFFCENQIKHYPNI